MSKIVSADKSNMPNSVVEVSGADEADFTGDALPKSPGLPAPEDRPYNPNRDRENVRSFVAKGLLLLLLGTVAVSFICLSAGWISKEDLKDLLTIVFGPIITLLGAVTGFYYGEKASS